MNIKDTLTSISSSYIFRFWFCYCKTSYGIFSSNTINGFKIYVCSIYFNLVVSNTKRIFKKDIYRIFIANTLQYSITYTGLNLIDASAAVLLVQTEVPFGVIFAYFMLKEKPTIRALVGISIAFIGVYILTGSPNLDGKFIGISLTILGSGIWALGQVIVKPLSKVINPIALVAWLAFFSGPILIILICNNRWKYN